MFVFAILISLTGIGAIVGIPLAIGSAGVFLISPVAPLFMYVGRCPYCQQKVRMISLLKKVAKCRQCKNRYVLIDDQFKPVKSFVQQQPSELATSEKRSRES